MFDILSNGVPKRVAWTRAGARDALLALDRNGNGRIDDSSELFGNFTAQPATNKKGGANGFLALREFDKSSNGGNGDGQITEADTVYTNLRLWVDGNHDGISQPIELKTLDELGVRAISLHYVLGKRTDEFGNQMHFRGHVTMDRDAVDPGPLKRQAIDVVFKYLPIR